VTISSTGELVKCQNDPSFDAQINSNYSLCWGNLIPVYENITSSWESLIEDLTHPKGLLSEPTYPLKWSIGLATTCREINVEWEGQREEQRIDEKLLESIANRYVTWLNISKSFVLTWLSYESSFEAHTRILIEDEFHWQNTFNKAWTHTGISCLNTSSLETKCCILFGQ